jgi:tetratricopeptide (TPR) repeat protein
MSLRTKLVFELLLLLLLLVFAVSPSLALDNTYNQNFQPQYKLPDNYSGNFTRLEETNSIEEDILLQSDRNFDQTLSMLNLVIAGIGVLIALIGVLVGLITFIAALATIFGFSGYKSVKEFRSSMEATLKNAEERSENKLVEMEDNLEKTRNMCEEAETQLKNALNKLNEYARNEIDLMKKEIQADPALLSNKNPPTEFIEILNKYEARLGIIEALGMPLEPSDLLNRGVYLYHKHKYHDAIKVFDKLLLSEPNNIDILVHKGICLTRLGNLQEAIQIYNEAIEIEPDNGYVFYNLACAYSLMKNKELAIYYLKRSIDFRPAIKKVAKEDADFKDFLEDIDFKKLIE